MSFEASSPSSAAPLDADRARQAQRATWVSIAINVVLTVCQIAVGLFAHAQSLVADGMHTLSDLLGDFMVMFASRHGANPADERHPYGHGRYETAASMVLGLILAGHELGAMIKTAIIQVIWSLPMTAGSVAAAETSDRRRRARSGYRLLASCQITSSPLSLIALATCSLLRSSLMANCSSSRVGSAYPPGWVLEPALTLVIPSGITTSRNWADSRVESDNSSSVSKRRQAQMSWISWRSVIG